MNEAETAALVEKCLAGDELAIEQFVRQFQQRVFGLCLKLLGHRQEAEDAAQETLVRSIKYLGTWDRSRPLEPWVLMIAANRCRTARAKQARRPKESEEILATADGSPKSQMDLAEELDRALALLRDEYRECFVLFYQQELSIVDVSEILQVPTGTIKTWLHRARKELATHLADRGVAPYDRLDSGR